MFSENDIKLMALQEENFNLKNEIEFLRHQLCGESGHKFKYSRRELSENREPIFCMLDNESIQVREWHDVTNVYVCEKCGFAKYENEKLPTGYSKGVGGAIFIKRKLQMR